MAFFSKTAATEQAYAANLAEIKKTIQEDFQFPLADRDRESLEYVFKSFRENGLDIAFRLDASYYGGYFPSLKDLTLQTDLNGKTGNFLASADDYNFVRSMQKKNLIIPVVGDFSGTKALAAIGEPARTLYIADSSFSPDSDQGAGWQDIKCPILPHKKKLASQLDVYVSGKQYGGPDNANISKRHMGGANAVFMDGHAKWHTYNTFIWERSPEKEIWGHFSSPEPE